MYCDLDMKITSGGWSYRTALLHKTNFINIIRGIGSPCYNQDINYSLDKTKVKGTYPFQCNEVHIGISSTH